MTRPAVQGSPIRFYGRDVVERIVPYQPSPERRALFSLLYGTGIEVSTALGLTRADVWEATREVRAAGTKAHSRGQGLSGGGLGLGAGLDHCRRMLPAALRGPCWESVDSPGLAPRDGSGPENSRDGIPCTAPETTGWYVQQESEPHRGY